MTCIDKIILAFVVVQVALVLAKPHEPEYDDGLYHYNDDMEYFLHKRGGDCGGGCEPEGCYSRKCRSSCRDKERHISMFDNKCSGGEKCCMCHVGWNNGCSYDG